jgi:hypothetical protein
MPRVFDQLDQENLALLADRLFFNPRATAFVTGPADEIHQLVHCCTLHFSQPLGPEGSSPSSLAPFKRPGLRTTGMAITLLMFPLQ